MNATVFTALVHRADPCGQLGRRVDVTAGAEGLHRVHQRAPVGAASAKELAFALELVRVLQPRQRQVSFGSPGRAVSGWNRGVDSACRVKQEVNHSSPDLVLV